MESSFSKEDYLFDGKTVRAIIPAGTTGNIDMKITGAAGRRISGGVLFAIDAEFGDEITFQVVDVDNLYGYGAGVCLNEYLTWSVDPRNQMFIDLNYAGKIPQGIYLRGIYRSTGILPVKVAVNHMLHREL